MIPIERTPTTSMPLVIDMQVLGRREWVDAPIPRTIDDARTAAFAWATSIGGDRVDDWSDRAARALGLRTFGAPAWYQDELRRRRANRDDVHTPAPF